MRQWTAIAVPSALAAAIALALSWPSSAAIPVFAQGQLGPLDSTELGRVASIVAQCWPGALETADQICLVLDVETQPASLRVDIEGKRRLTRRQARDELAARRPVGRGATKAEEAHCALAGPRLAAARVLETSHWGGTGAIMRLCARRSGADWAWIASQGVVQLDEDDLITRAENGEDIQPVPVASP